MCSCPPSIGPVELGLPGKEHPGQQLLAGATVIHAIDELRRDEHHITGRELIHASVCLVFPYLDGARTCNDHRHLSTAGMILVGKVCSSVRLSQCYLQSPGTEFDYAEVRYPIAHDLGSEVAAPRCAIGGAHDANVGISLPFLLCHGLHLLLSSSGITCTADASSSQRMTSKERLCR